MYMKQILLTPLIFILAIFLSVGPSFAQGQALGPGGTQGGELCDIAKASILKMLDSYSTSLVSTGLVHSEVLSSIKPFYMGLGMSHGEQMGCLGYIASAANLGGEFDAAVNSLGCAETDQAICESLLNQYNQGSTGSGYDGRKFAQGKVSGSLLGYTYFVQNTLKYEPVPVNMAYFFNDYLAKIPVIGETAYAQSQTDYGQVLINAVLNMWKVFRNIAYALMSVIMLWVGFAIITRRRIAAQTVVNVQYALPKIVIALVFIALSYPIGALITSFSWTLFNSSTEIIASITGVTPAAAGQGLGLSLSQANEALKNIGVGGLMTVLLLIMTAAAGTGGLLALQGFVLIVVLVFVLFAYIKAFWLYLKMVIHTATAPLHIALYALPGQDDKLEMWFKQMLAWGGGIFGMRLVLDLVMAFSMDLLLQSFLPVISGSQSVGVAIVSGSLFNVAIAPLMTIFGAATAIKIPSTIENMLIGPKKR